MSEPRLSHGFKLLQILLEQLPDGRVFTTGEAVRAGSELELTTAHVHKLLSDLASGAILARPRPGLYVMRPPSGGRYEVLPIAIAVRAAEPAAIAGLTALSHWGLIDQVPVKS